MTQIETEPQTTTPEPAAVPLTRFRSGQTGTVEGHELGGDEGELLRAMGLRPDCQIKVCRVGTPCIVEVKSDCGGGCRIGLAKHVAKRLLVRPTA